METKAADSNLAHLHVHSEYSLIDGAIKINDLVATAKQWGHKAVALTDHGNMFGAVEFYTTAKAAGIKPIIGAEIFLEETPHTARLREQLKQQAPRPFHLVLLAKSNAGYKSLVKIVSYGHLHGKTSADVPIVSQEDLKKHTADLIVLSSCLQGELGYLASLFLTFGGSVKALQGKITATPQQTLIRTTFQNVINEYITAFGRDDFFVELIDNGTESQARILPILEEIANQSQLRMVATADAHYLAKEDRDAHVILTGIKNDTTLVGMKHRSKDYQYHLFDDSEMRARYQQYGDGSALANIADIVSRCDVTLEFGKYFLPNYETEDNESVDEALRRLAHQGLSERLQTPDKPVPEEIKVKYEARLVHELDVIISMGFPGYFLIVQDFINWAKQQNIPVGPGRGSGAGSLVAYALKITDLDPIPLNLIFERFLNPERVSMPDFDVDFCQSRRDEVIQYVIEKYGANNVAQITTFGKMKAKAAVRDVGRALNVSYGRVDRLAKLIPNELDITLKAALEREPRIKEEMAQDQIVKDLFSYALKIEGLCRHTSVHAAGVVISEGGMENYVPVYHSEDGQLITQYEMKNAEKVGLVKFDFLGLKTLTVIQNAIDIINESRDQPFAIEHIPLDDRKVYEEISTGETVGIFQLESSGMQALVSKLKPSCFEDVIAIVALFRPGPLGSGMVDDFIERKHGRQECTYLLPQLEPILRETYGIILYQEQVQKIAATLASYSLGEADLLRRAMGKKKPEEMARQKSRFISGCENNGIDKAIADELFELMAKFAAYGFNKSHSAAYGLISYQTAYLKTHYPEEYLAAIMTCDLDNSEKLLRYFKECRRLRFEILPPDINRSELNFSVPEKKSISYALAAIKGIGSGPLAELLEERRRRGPYASLTSMAQRTNLQRVTKKTLELLTYAGALDTFQESREHIASLIPALVKYSESIHQAKGFGQASLFDDSGSGGNQAFTPPPTSLSHNDDFGNLSYQMLLREKRLLGTFLSGHPSELFANDGKLLGCVDLANAQKQVGKKNIPVVVFLADIQERTTKNGKRMLYLQIEDQTNSIEVPMFPDEDDQSYPKKESMAFVMLSVTKHYDGSRINIRAESLQPLADARNLRLKMLKLNIEVAEEHQALKVIDELSHLLEVTNHGVPLTLNLIFQQGSVKLRSDQQIKVSDSFCENMLAYRARGVSMSFERNGPS